MVDCVTCDASDTVPDCEIVCVVENVDDVHFDTVAEFDDVCEVDIKADFDADDDILISVVVVATKEELPVTLALLVTVSGDLDAEEQPERDGLIEADGLNSDELVCEGDALLEGEIEVLELFERKPVGLVDGVGVTVRTEVRETTNEDDTEDDTQLDALELNVPNGVPVYDPLEQELIDVVDDKVGDKVAETVKTKDVVAFAVFVAPSPPPLDEDESNDADGENDNDIEGLAVDVCEVLAEEVIEAARDSEMEAVTVPVVLEVCEIVTDTVPVIVTLPEYVEDTLVDVE